MRPEGNLALAVFHPSAPRRIAPREAEVLRFPRTAAAAPPPTQPAPGWRVSHFVSLDGAAWPVFVPER